MALKVELKPGERIIIGTSVVTNGDSRTRLVIEGDTPILREKDILTAETANTPARRIYLAIQLMYFHGAEEPHRKLYGELIQQLVEAVPSTLPFVDRINNALLTGSFYKGLREAKSLIAYEQELMDAARGRTSLRADRAENGKPEGS